MTTALTLLILIAPFAVAAALSWAAHRSGSLRVRLVQFRLAAPLGGLFDDRDAYRVEHDVDAIRTRFEREPSWPASGAVGERRWERFDRLLIDPRRVVVHQMTGAGHVQIRCPVAGLIHFAHLSPRCH
jgi:hypothetical protein